MPLRLLARDLALADDWFITPESAAQVGEEATLMYAHGIGGVAAFKIYGSSNFDQTSTELIGETCRSSGGVLQEPLVGLSVAPNFGDTASSLGIAIDTAAVQNNAVIYRASGDIGTEYIVQFCVSFSLTNDANEEANFVETEIRFVQSQDGALFVNTAGPFTSRTPEALQVVTSSGLTAEICKIPEAQGAVVSICIATPENAAMQISTVDSFVFKTGGELVQQLAFVDGSPSSLTEIAVNDGASFQFNTILKAEFYTSQSSTVIGEGSCTMLNGHRAVLQLQAPSSRNESDGPMLENEILSLAFTIGEHEQTVMHGPDASPKMTGAPAASSIKKERSAAASDPNKAMFNMVIISLTASLLASLAAMTAVGLFFFGKHPRLNVHPGGDESVQEDEIYEVNLLRWV